MDVEIKEKEAKRKKRNDDVDELIFNFICLKNWGKSIQTSGMAITSL